MEILLFIIFFRHEDLTALYEAEVEEFEDPVDVVRQKVKNIAHAIKNAKHVVVFTGAGISVAAKLVIHLLFFYFPNQ